MREIDLMSVDQCDNLGKLEDSRPLEDPVAGREGGGQVDLMVKQEDVESSEESGGSRRRGRRLICRAKAKTSAAVSLPRKRREEEEDVCFVCFDGGSLVLCDRRGCPKAYHPACVKRDEAFFRSTAKWNCGWHICTSCQKNSYYMCYTCPYSVCKRCVKKADYSNVRGNKGFCGICMKTILLMENVVEGDEEKVQVDFDDKSSWEYLFKIYWISLKEKLSLSVDELKKAKYTWKATCSLASKGKQLPELCDHSDGSVCYPDSSCGGLVENRAKRRKTRSQLTFINKSDSLNSNLSGERTLSPLNGTKWATEELLEFVAHMTNVDTTIRSKYEVQALVLEYVKRNNLDDPLQNCQIICDSKLMSLFGKERVSYFEMFKFLEPHFLTQEKSPEANAISGGVTKAVPFCSDSPDIQFGPSDSLRINQPMSRFESSVAFSKELPAGYDDGMNDLIKGLDTNRIWHYQDPTGKIQGPFSMSNLRHWSRSGHFPSDLRIWRVNEKQDDSILLTDALDVHCHKASLLPDGSLPAQEAETTHDWSGCVNAAKMDNNRQDVSPNSFCTEASVISSGNSVITGNSFASNMTVNSCNYGSPLDSALSTEGKTRVSISLWDKSKDDTNSLPGHRQVSCSLSLGMFPGNSSGILSREISESHVMERVNDSNGISAKLLDNQIDFGIGCRTEKQRDLGGNPIQSCGQNWNSNSGFVSFADTLNTSKLLQEIDFLDLPSPTLKSSLVSNASDWQPFVADLNECDESVSDLLAEVEAMESLKGLPSPTSAFHGVAELTRVSKNDSFSPGEGFSPALDLSKGDAVSSTNDLQMPSKSRVLDW